MPAFPVHLNYTLNRSQRIVPLLRTWGPIYILAVLASFLFFGIRFAAAVFTLEFAAIPLFGGLLLFWAWFFRDLCLQLLDIVLVPIRQMDVIFEQDAVGMQLGSERSYLWLDSFTDIRKHCSDTWTLQYWNGAEIHILDSVMDQELIEHVRDAMKRGQTTAGVQAIVERGRMIDYVMQHDDTV